jgi:hypothetical protein
LLPITTHWLIKVDAFRLMLHTTCKPVTVNKPLTTFSICSLFDNFFIKLFQIIALGDQYISQGEKIYEAKANELIGKD